MADPQGIAVAFTDATLEPDPAWTRLDVAPSVPWRVQGYTVRRGRQSELDKTGTGVATVTIADPAGDFDPTNPTATFAGQLNPMRQAAIVITNPVTLEDRHLFRGFIEDWPGEFHKTGRLQTLELEWVDGFALLETALMTPVSPPDPPLFGVLPPFGSDGDIYFPATTGTQQVRGRINLILGQAGWPPELTHIFSGNVDLMAAIYSRRESVLTVLLDCADAEFPAVSQIFMSRRGTVVFRGRYARFDPLNYISTDDDDLRTGPAGVGGRLWTWSCGGRPQCDADPDVALISDISWRRSANDIINAAVAAPKGASDEDVEGQLYKDDTSIGLYGWRFGPDMEGLLVNAGNTPPGHTAKVETGFYAEYWVENFKAPHTRITKLVFRGLPLADIAAPATWALICGVEIGDVLHVETSHFNGAGGFDGDYFIEGISYDVRPAMPGVPDITLELDVSPATFYAHNPWGTTTPPEDNDSVWVPE